MSTCLQGKQYCLALVTPLFGHSNDHTADPPPVNDGLRVPNDRNRLTIIVRPAHRLPRSRKQVTLNRPQSRWIRLVEPWNPFGPVPAPNQLRVPEVHDRLEASLRIPGEIVPAVLKVPFVSAENGD